MWVRGSGPTLADQQRLLTARRVHANRSKIIPTLPSHLIPAMEFGQSSSATALIVYDRSRSKAYGRVQPFILVICEAVQCLGMRCRQPGTLQISATLGAGQRGRGDQVATMRLRLLNSMRYQCSMVAKAPGILSGGSRSKVGNAITGQIH